MTRSYVETSNKQEKFEAEFCICTFPPGVINKYHRQIFNPELPIDKIEAYQQISPGAVCKYFVEWKKPWRDLNSSPIMIAWDKDDLMKIGELY